MDQDDINAYYVRNSLWPAIVFTVLMMVAGIIGNGLVLVVYRKDYHRNVAWIFVYFLAILDMCACFISLPTEITLFVKHAFFPSREWCRISRYTSFVFYESTCVVLMVIAYSRYDTICRGKTTPRFNCDRAKKSCVAVVVFNLIINIPALVIYGEAKVPLVVTNGTVEVLSGGGNWTLNYPPMSKLVRASMCTVDSQYYDHKLTHFFFYFHFTLFIALVVLVVFFYTKVIRKLARHQRRRNTMDASIRSAGSNGKDDELGTSPGAGARPAFPLSDRNNRSQSASRPRTTSYARRASTSGRNINPLRTSMMLLFISGAFVISFLPSYVILVWRTVAGPGAVGAMSPMAYGMFILVVRSSTASNAINPILYGVLNRDFRRRCRQLCKRTVT